jgi:2-aminoadipate transaminase
MTTTISTFWEEHLSQGARNITSSAIRDLLKVTEQPDMISFAGGLPAPECFPAEEITAAAERVLVERPLAALQYGPTEGYGPLRELLASKTSELGINVSIDQVLVTSGSQQALDLLGKLFLEPQAPVVVEEPTYLGALQAWRPYQPAFFTVPLDADGMDVDALEALLASGLRPRFCYLVSCFQNPTGVTLSPERRRKLIELAAQYQMLIVEDDPYGELAYDGPRTTPLAAIDVELHGELRHVVYLSTLSKQLAPGMRVGWVAAPTTLIGRMAHAKQGMDLHSSSMAQAVAYEACREGLLERHIPVIRSIYRARRDAMCAALEAYMPAEVRWNRPHGGMFVWLTLPEQIDTTRLLSASLEHHVAFVPGTTFFANGGGHNTMRLNFSHPTSERITEGIKRLADAIRDSF